MGKTFVFRETVTYRVTVCDLGEVDEETGEVAFTTPEEQEASAREWAESAQPVEYYPDEFVEVEESGLQREGER